MIDVLDLDPSLTAIVRRRCPPAQMPQAQREGRLALSAALGEASDIMGRRLTIWRPPEGGMIDYRPGVFLSRPLDVSGDVELFTLPGGSAAHLRLTGAYDRLPQAWGSLFEECHRRGFALAGLNWEVYAPDDAAPDAAGADLYALLA